MSELPSRRSSLHRRAGVRAGGLFVAIALVLAVLAVPASAIPASLATPVASPSAATPLASPVASPVVSPVAVKLPKHVPRGAVPAQVRGYLDGAGLKVRIEGKSEEIVLIGVDAPRKKNADGEADCYAAEFADRLRGLVRTKTTVYLEADATGSDADGRLPRFVWVPNRHGDSAFLLNSKLVGEGVAKLGPLGSSGRHAADFAKADTRAKDSNLGIWSACFAPNGNWSGTTNDGGTVAFTVTNHGLASLRITFACTVENGYIVVTDTVTYRQPKPLPHDGFSVSALHGTEIVFAGAFTSPTEASGTLQITAKEGGCAGYATTTSWYATLSQ